MKSIKIGNLVLHPKAILLIILCLFLNGVTIGVSVASNQLNNNGITIFILLLLLILPYILFFRTISKNISEHN